ncbi:MAG: RNase H family protein [Christensenellales bacterium]
MKKVTIYCDGACSGNPGPGGWGGILMYQSFKKELSGYHPQTTNNRMELQACIECPASRALRSGCLTQCLSV